MRTLLAAVAAGLLFPRVCLADLSFLQVVQAQTGRGQEGTFGKTWVEISGRKMRLVSGYASRLKEGKEPEEPRRLIQIIDLDKASRTVVYPEEKTYARAPFGEVEYDSRLDSALAREGGAGSLRVDSAELERQASTREMLGTTCERWRLRVRMTVLSTAQGNRRAVMEQDLWLAPLSGPLMATALDLIAFENAYRKASGSPMSPLDFERYQLREAASFLRVPAAELGAVAERARAELRELPSFPVASSVAWWSPDETEEAAEPPPPKPEAALKALRPEEVPAYARPSPRPRVRVMVYPRTARFRVIDWRRSERLIDRMYFRTRTQFAGTFQLGRMPGGRTVVLRGSPREAPVYPRFERGLRQTVEQLKPPAPARASAPKAPFYEVYTELHGLEGSTEVPLGDFSLPPGYREVPYVP